MKNLFLTVWLILLLWDANVLGFRIKRQINEDDVSEDVVSPSGPCKTDAGESGFCEILTVCQSALSNIESFANNTCSLDDKGTSGVCCSNVTVFAVGFSGPERRVLPASSPPAPVAIPQVSPSALEKISTNAISTVENEVKLEDSLVAQGLTVQTNTAEDLHNLITFAQPEAQAIGKRGAIALAASQEISKEFHLEVGSAQRALAGVSFSSSVPISSGCGSSIDCPANKYRTIDGSCNNLMNKDWGTAFSAFNRMSKAQYADGISKPRIAKSGDALPLCRLVTTSIVSAQSKIQPHVDTLFVAFGQFVDHDLSQTPTNRIVNADKTAACCPPKISLENQHPECMTIDIPKEDPFFKQFGVECMEFVRSLEAASTDCIFGQREQQNQLTSYLDASHIYGNIPRIADSLRDKDKGRLKVSVGKFGQDFPPNKASPLCKGNENENTFCLETGDVRATEQPLLGALHVVFLREHNRIAGRLAKLNPTWDSETLYQETRRLVIAIYQHIVYNEFLPLLLGNHWMQNYDLKLLKFGFYDNYDSFQSAGILNEFATAAFRYGHSLVQPNIVLISDTDKVENQRLLDHFVVPFNGSLLESYIRGATSQSSQQMDKNVIAELTNHLFQRNNKFGLDLAAINCQRGRDHAIGTYSSLRQTCGLEPVSSFDDLKKHMDSSVAKSFASVYKDVEDIDLWVAGISERPYPGAVLGPVFSCIIGEQFKRLREGDRFWYERGNTESSFNEAQLRQIRKSTLARLLCDNADIETVQSLAFITASRWNPKVSCHSSPAIPKLSFKSWKI